MDDIDSFMKYYRDNVRTISALSMRRQMGEIIDDLLDANICWMVTDNMKGILSTSSEPISELHRAKDIPTIRKFIKDELENNRLLIVGQDLDVGQDHWFAIVGSYGYAYIIEHLEEMCNSYQAMTVDQSVDELTDILTGTRPDRFYHVQGPHYFDIILSYSRYTLSVETIDHYIEELG